MPRTFGQPTRNKWLSLWQAALGQDLGLCIRVQATSTLAALKTNLESARRQTKGTEYLAHLYLRTSPSDPQHEVWIINPPQVEEGGDPSSFDAELKALLGPNAQPQRFSPSTALDLGVEDDGEVQW